MVKGLGLILSLMLLICVIPAYAYTDLESYTAAGNYLPPAYGKYLNGDYSYTFGGVSWNNGLTESFEKDGYYLIKNPIDKYEFTPMIQVKAAYAGDVLFCVDSYLYDSFQTQCDIIGTYNTPNSFQTISKNVDLRTLISTQSGSLCKYYYRINFNGGSAISWKYNFLWAVDNLYSNYIPISISSLSNISQGVVTVTLNSTYTKMLEDSNCISYDNDGQENTLSGTLSCITFTDTGKSLAYPYFIESYKGGFYNYSRNTTNTTIIKVFVNEDTTLKGLYMYFNTTNYNHSVTIYSALQGYYNLSGRSDDNNNPFLIHQLFNDLRYNQTFSQAFIYNGSDTLNSYTRNTSLSLISDGARGLKYSMPNNISSLLVTYLYASQGTITWKFYRFNNGQPIFYLNRSGSTCTSGIYNSSTSQGATILSCTADTSKYIFIRDGNISFSNDGSTIQNTLTESETLFSINNFTVFKTGTGNYEEFFGKVYTLFPVTSTNTYSSAVNTTPLNLSNVPISSISPHTPSDTRLNRIPIYYDLVTNQNGTVYCNVYNSTKVTNSVKIPLTNLTDYNLILYLEYTNKTEFFNLNNTQILVKCNFITDSGTTNTSYYPISFENELVYLSNINPIHYYNYDSFNIPFTVNLEYNYNLTYHNTIFNYGFGSVNCFNIYQGKCIRYIENSWYTIGNVYIELFGKMIPIKNDVVNPSSFSSSNLISSYAKNSTCYNLRFWLRIANTTETGNTSEYEINDQLFCIRVNDSDFGTNISKPDKLKNTSCFINYIPSGTSIANMSAYFWNRPDCYIGSFVYSMVGLLTTDANWKDTFLSLLIIFCNFYFVTLFVGMSFWFAAAATMPNNDKTHYAGLIAGGIAFVFFVMKGWIPIDLTLLILMAISITVLYIWKRNN